MKQRQVVWPKKSSCDLTTRDLICAGLKQIKNNMPQDLSNTIGYSAAFSPRLLLPRKHTNHGKHATLKAFHYRCTAFSRQALDFGSFMDYLSTACL
jgi:hypothetical protein